MKPQELPQPHEPKQQSIQDLFCNMNKLKTDFFDSIKVITDDYEQKRLINSLTYGSYHANRGYGMSAESYAKMMGWNEVTAQQYEAAYQSNLEQERSDKRYSELMNDLDLIDKNQRGFYEFIHELNK